MTVKDESQRGGVEKAVVAHFKITNSGYSLFIRVLYAPA